MPALRKPRTSARKHIARAVILVAVLNLVYTVVTRAADLPAVFRSALRRADLGPQYPPACWAHLRKRPCARQSCARRSPCRSMWLAAGLRGLCPQRAAAASLCRCPPPAGRK